jgi:RHS repeat-associated protein
MEAEQPNANQIGRKNLYQYNGKELNGDFGLNWSDYGARWYDASLGRWWSVDKLADAPEQVGFSPYNYTWNNPVNLTDPDGNSPLWPPAIPIITAIIEIVGDALIATAATTAAVGATSIAVGTAAQAPNAQDAMVPLHAQLYQAQYLKSVEQKPGQVQANSNNSNNGTNGSQGANNSQTSNASPPIPKPPTGKGTVPPDQRDPKRVFSRTERSDRLDKQNGKCAQCGADKTVDEVHAHHEIRHADGGKTDASNIKAVCTDCHKELHKKQ